MTHNIREKVSSSGFDREWAVRETLRSQQLYLADRYVGDWLIEQIDSAAHQTV